ncbi:hypothetical protein H112_07344 [Trichophyton rubrum D6]|uniref:Uncharacterized protein n=3 Tax=Trichophyton rubrum TaxID=5551 RepID=A0A178EZJ2_TRIRU|nr:uncharacterized protein TERG_02664 [Trichophyton rubrum CBS 118892]EZF11531.1 hypothetical protein H100_07371 [Trichophyton rubrum MR850]EZF38455.1 hypothetical protein H102_07332 [Trichophyton rubrum CBS 100081]EZF49046.1 hypothetical protein H103_07355 [Trichophyton rubrum CBS 288.86]EZF59677.1 hypothetical protein H104_07307 [Trichophyton rubrum CBS 289.86]EZF80963.1 hypothetical protein H110_07353 [Trichophyton rubrum MR1448]EZF91640.1 hypothetical protein H113_07407 [Trichophyton rubr
MAEPMTFAAPYGRADERMADMVTPDGHGYAEPMFSEPVMEPWMDGVLDETLMMAAPSSWDNFDALDSAVSQATATPNAFDSMLADCSLPADSQASSDGDLTVSPDMLNISSNLAFPESEISSLLGTEFSNYFSTFDSTTTDNTSFSTQTTPESTAGDNCELVFEQVASAFKDLARARAAADPRPISRKQKQRDASIALYLERLRDTCNEAVAALNSGANNTTAMGHSAAWFNSNQVSMSSQPSSSGASSFSTSSPSEGYTEFHSQSQSTRSSVPSQSPTLDQSRPQFQQPSPPAPPSGGIELVMDLNMNTATSLPRKHRPRTETQRQRYLAVRNQGACEKHKKQHKRCTCIDKEIPLVSTSTATTTASSSPQAGAGASNGIDATISILSHTKGRHSVRKTSPLRRVPSVRGARDSLSPTSGEDNWSGLGHDGEVLIRNNRPDGIAKGEAGMACSASYLLQRQGKLDQCRDSGHDIGNSHDKGVSRHRVASGERVSTLPTNTGNVAWSVMPQAVLDRNIGWSITPQAVLDSNVSVRSRTTGGCEPTRNRDTGGHGYYARCADGSVSATMCLGNRDQGRRAISTASSLVFPDGTWQCPHGQSATNSQSHSTNIGSSSDIDGSRLAQISSYLHLRDKKEDKQKHTCFHTWSNGDRNSSLSSATAAASAKAHNINNNCCTNAAAHLRRTTDLVFSTIINSQSLKNRNAICDECCAGSMSSALLQPSASNISSAYAGLRWYIQAHINDSVRSSLKRATPRQLEFALWCFIWISMLVLSAIFKGALA